MALDELGLSTREHLRTELMLTTDLARSRASSELFQYDTRLELGFEGVSLSHCVVPFPGLIVFELTDLSSFWGPLQHLLLEVDSRKRLIQLARHVAGIVHSLRFVEVEDASKAP